MWSAGRACKSTRCQTKQHHRAMARRAGMQLARALWSWSVRSENVRPTGIDEAAEARQPREIKPGDGTLPAHCFAARPRPAPPVAGARSACHAIAEKYQLSTKDSFTCKGTAARRSFCQLVRSFPRAHPPVTLSLPRNCASASGGGGGWAVVRTGSSSSMPACR